MKQLALAVAILLLVFCSCEKDNKDDLGGLVSPEYRGYWGLIYAKTVDNSQLWTDPFDEYINIHDDGFVCNGRINGWGDFEGKIGQTGSGTSAVLKIKNNTHFITLSGITSTNNIIKTTCDKEYGNLYSSTKATRIFFAFGANILAGVVTGNSMPQPNAVVTLYKNKIKVADCITDVDGIYAFPNTETGEYKIRVQRVAYEDYYTEYENIHVDMYGATIRNVSMKPGKSTLSMGLIKGTFMDYSNNKVYSSFVDIRCDGSYVNAEGSDNNYYFYTEPGQHTIVFQYNGYEPDTFRVNVVEQQEYTHDVVFQKLKRTVSGRVTHATQGTAIEGVRVEVSATEGSTTDGNGNYSFRATPGTRTITARKAGFSDYSQSIFIPENSDVSLDIEMNPGGGGGGSNVSGTLVNAFTGEPVQGAIVNFGTIYDYESTTTDYQGKFALNKPIETGTMYIFQITGEGYYDVYNTYTFNNTTDKLNLFIKFIPQNTGNTVLFGKVKDGTIPSPQQKGISGVTVTYGTYSTVTDSVGGYAFEVTPSENEDLVCTRNGYLKLRKPDIEITSNNDNEFDLHIYPLSDCIEVSVSGTVFIKGTSTPIEGVKVTSELGGSAYTNAEGKYSLTTIIPNSVGTYWSNITAEKSGYRSAIILSSLSSIIPNVGFDFMLEP